MNTKPLLSRRTLIKRLAAASTLVQSHSFLSGALRAAPFSGALVQSSGGPANLPFAEARFKPHYPAVSDLADVLRLVQPGSDSYVTEKYATEIERALKQWATSLQRSPHDTSSLATLLPDSPEASPLDAGRAKVLRSGFGIDVTRTDLPGARPTTREAFLREVRAWLNAFVRVETAEFQVYEIALLSATPLSVQVSVRYDIVATREGDRREERVGVWHMVWTRDTIQTSAPWTIRRWEAFSETSAIATGPGFVDVTSQALGSNASYPAQMLRGVDHWRTVLDAACAPDIYANNGVAAGDFDNDGFDDLYVCQPAGLPNRLYRNRGDGTFDDVTEKAGVGVLDNTACALFADFDNRGLQDLLVVCGSGPLLYQNRGDGTFALKRDSFAFSAPPQGTFTHAAIADYDGDGRLDIVCCTYQYYLGLDQYHYPAPYYDARNGPPNLLLHNEGDGRFVETTARAGMNVENDRYTFACAWGDSNGNGHPDLVVANDFGTSQLYRNKGDGTFTHASSDSRIEDVGAGMSACWSDFDNDGHQDIYITGMWEAAGQRVSGQPQFHAVAPVGIREKYQRHARGNALYRNIGDGTFLNAGQQTGTAMGRWSWSADLWDIDHDGFPDLYVTNGYLTGPGESTEGDQSQNDLASFFWRQVVAASPEDATPRLAYERGWNAINELARSDSSWNAHERNVLFANNRDGTFSEASGALNLDCLEDSRSFALADIDHDGRLEVILKNRNAPQIRILRNAITGTGDSIAFRLRGRKSNRDAIGACITLTCGPLRQTRYLQAGSGFLAQHSKELFFGLGTVTLGTTLLATIRWPSGLLQNFEALPANHRIEIEEGAAAFTATAFAKAPATYATAAAIPPAKPLPTTVETWLISPLKAPSFTLPDLSGQPFDLKQFTGGFVLLHLWATATPGCREQLLRFDHHHAAFAAVRLTMLALNLNPPAEVAEARAVATSLQFPVLLATEEVAGVYNLVFRYLFDRRRDLALPTSFLLDRDGMIVKVYQGTVDSNRVLDDLRIVPKDAAERRALALPFPGQTVQSDFQRNDFTYGVAFFQHGYLDQAAEAFEQVVAARPEDAEAYYNLGTLHLRRNNFGEARRDLHRTLELRPDYPEAWNNLGMMSAQEGHAEDAIASFEQAIALRPGYETALLNLGNIYRRQKEYAKAQQSLDHALALQPDDPEVNYSLGMLNAQQNQLEEAAAFLQKAIALRPSYPEALNNLGIVFVRLQQTAKAEEQFKAAIRDVPGNDQGYLNLARVYALQDNRPAARDILRQLLQLQPQNATAARALEGLQ